MTYKDPILEAIAKLTSAVEQQEREILTLKHEQLLLEKQLRILQKDHEIKLRHLNRQTRNAKKNQR